MPSTMLAFADDGTGNILCLGIAAENAGQVFFLDHELHPFDKSDTETGITRIADSSRISWPPSRSIRTMSGLPNNSLKLTRRAGLSGMLKSPAGLA